MRIKKLATMPLTLLLLAVSLPALAQKNWDVVKTFPIGGQGSWDYLTVDPATHRLFVPRTTHTMVIDADSGKTYDIDHQDEVKQFEGKKVRVHGTLDASGKMIHVQ